MSREELDQLIDTLVDRSVRFNVRDFAVVDIATAIAHSNPATAPEPFYGRVVDVLVDLTTDPTEAQAIHDEAGSALADILIKTDSFDRGVYERLTPVARAKAKPCSRRNADS